METKMVSMRTRCTDIQETMRPCDSNNVNLMKHDWHVVPADPRKFAADLDGLTAMRPCHNDMYIILLH